MIRTVSGSDNGASCGLSVGTMRTFSASVNKKVLRPVVGRRIRAMPILANRRTLHADALQNDH